MTARSYDTEEYLPWYRQPTPTWLELSAAARGVLVSVAMTLNHRTGEVHLRKGLPSLATLLRLPWEELEPALSELLAAGKLEWDGSRFVLRDPEFLNRQRPRPKTAAERMRDLRARRSESVTPRDASDERPSRDGCDDNRSDQNRSDPPKPPDVAPRRIVSGTPLAVEIVEAYQTAVSSETGIPCALSGPGPRGDLLTAAEAHAPKDGGAQAVLDWVCREAIAWVRQHRGREQFTTGWAPKHFLAWLNGGKKPPATREPPPTTNGGASQRARKELT